MQFSDAQIEDIKRRTDLVKVAGELGAMLRPHKSRGVVGSCPLCGGTKNSHRFEVKDGVWVCAACQQGGDAIQLIRLVTGCSFVQAIERLGGASVLTEAEERKITAERAEKEREAEAAKEFYRQRELNAAQRIWRHARPVGDHSLVMRYLASRGLALPHSALIREERDIGYYHGTEKSRDGKDVPRRIHSGPAMVSALLDNKGDLHGVHLTFLALDGSGKLKLRDPDKDEELPAKKYRGQKMGVHIVLRQGAVIHRLFLSEGIETGLSVARSMHRAGKLLPGDAFWAAGDMGNLGGPHEANVLHPTAKAPSGRPVRVPGPVPEIGGKHAAIAIPETVHTLVLLGDGDSEPFLTGNAMQRAKARYAKPGRAIAIAMAPADMDFNDMLENKASPERERQLAKGMVAA